MNLSVESAAWLLAVVNQVNVNVGAADFAQVATRAAEAKAELEAIVAGETSK